MGQPALTARAAASACHPAAADKGPVNAEIGVLCRGANEDDGAVFHPGQEGILLGLVPAVYLVDKEDGALVMQGPPLLGLLRHPADVGHASQDGVEGFKVTARGVGNNRGQRGLARTGRSIKENRRQLVRLDGPAQQPARTDDVLLAYKLIQGTGSHASRQRCFALDLLLSGVVEKVHARIVAEERGLVNKPWAMWQVSQFCAIMIECPAKRVKGNSVLCARRARTQHTVPH